MSYTPNSESVISFENKVSQGFDYNTSGYVTYDSLALFSYQSSGATKAGILRSITINVGVSGTFTFAIGSLDFRNWAIISKEFNVTIGSTGRHTIDLSDRFLSISESEQLFVYTKKNGSETVNWKSYPSSNSNPNFIYGSPSGDIVPFTGTYGGGFVFTWDILPFKTYFASASEVEVIKSDVANVGDIANEAFNNIGKITDASGNVYKMWVVSGAITLQPLNYQNVLVVGNSLLTGLGGRGLASTVVGNDFASHLLTGILVKNGSATLTKVGAAQWERDLTTTSGGFDTLFTSTPVGPSGIDLIVIRLGENVNTVANLQTAIEAMIDYLKAKYPLVTILVTSTILDYSYSAKNTALSAAANSRGANYVAINGSTDSLQIGTSRIYRNSSNVLVPSDFTICTHSNDYGFLFIANSLLAALGYASVNKLFAINVTAGVVADYPTMGVKDGIISIKTYGVSAPTIVAADASSNSLTVTHYQLSTFTYDNRGKTGIADTATWVSTFIMPNSIATVTVN